MEALYGAHVCLISINHIGPIRKPFAKIDWGPYKEPTKAPYKNPVGTLVGVSCSAGWVVVLREIKFKYVKQKHKQRKYNYHPNWNV